jgi:hypothetical protein
MRALVLLARLALVLARVSGASLAALAGLSAVLGELARQGLGLLIRLLLARP